MVKTQQKTASYKKLNSVAESGTIKKNWDGRKAVALIYPNIYHVGMSNLGFQTVYNQLNGFEEIVCERVFLPATESQTPIPLRSVESNRNLSDFNLIAFSISFENDYLNVLTLLEKRGKPAFSSRVKTFR
jgi:hypothetical protein